ncbi:trypsin-like serine protease [Streptomyces galbus]|uniref:trypsin-like serine protease n=1 Tax=Streptomyces galbus TaxID=33898 RepID=UPI003EBAA789
MGELRADWRLRLRREDAHGPVCGAGVLVDQCTALTCAHVVGRPDAVLWVEFAENSTLAPVRARVLPDGWLPERGDGEDIAVLRLESPRPQARPTPGGPGGRHGGVRDRLCRRLRRGDEPVGAHRRGQR